MIQPDNQLQKVFPIFFNYPGQPFDIFWLLLHGNPSPTGPFYVILTFESWYLSNSHLPGWGDQVGTHNLTPNRANPVVSLGQWHFFELYIKRSDGPTSMDGVVQFWMDGILTHEYGVNNAPGINYPGRIQQFQFTPAWTGWIQYDIPFTNYQWFDHVRLSSSGGGTGNPNPPPSNCGNGLCDSGENASSCPSDCSVVPPPNPIGQMGSVQLAVATSDDSSVTLQFVEVADDHGAPANYFVCYSVAPLAWGSAVSAGNCQSVAGQQIGVTKNHRIAGLSSNTTYEFQAVAYRGTLNVDATFGSLSNVVSVTTANCPPAGCVQPPPNPTPGDVDATGTASCREDPNGTLNCDGSAVVQGCTGVAPQLLTLLPIAACFRQRLRKSPRRC